MLKIFPYILARIGGLSYDYLESLSWSNRKDLAIYFKAKEEIEEQRLQILEDLLFVVNKIEDYPAKFYLKILRRSIFNRRNIKIKAFNYEGFIKNEFEAVIKKVVQYKSNLLDWEKKTLKFEEIYEGELLKVRENLLKNEFPEALSKGLQLASHSFLKRLNTYQEKGTEKLNKKILQTERKLLQYLSRIAVKTSPFSSFTKLGLIDFKDQNLYSSQRKVRLNNSLFRLFKDALIHYPPFFRNLKIRLNASIYLNDDNTGSAQLKYLLNTRNIESIQEIERSDLIDFIIDLLDESQPNLTYSHFVNALAENVDADIESLEAYLLQLINYGLIEWDWPFSGLDPKWDEKLESILINNKDHLLIELKDLLKTAREWMQAFEIGTYSERLLIQQKAFERFKLLAEKLLEAAALKDVEQVATSDHLKNIFSTSFDLVREQLFYEDVSQTIHNNFAQEDFSNIAYDLEQLTNRLSPFYYNHSKERDLAFFKSNYPDGKVSLLSFYEAYFKKTNRETPEIAIHEINKRKAFLNHLIENGQWKSLHHFHLEIDAIPIFEKESKHQHKSKAAFLQLYKEQGKIKAFAETVLMGYGKMFGRFLHLFPDSLTIAIEENNKRLNNKDHLWVENVDASIYNPNVHPSLMSYEIQLPGSQNNLSAEQQIPIRDLEIHLEKETNALFLWDKKRKKRLVIFDYGFEALNNRSPMYQLLARFNYQLVGPDILVNILDNKLIAKDENGIIHQPRISVGAYLIIRRRGWAIPIAIVPKKEAAESHAAYFTKINSWRRAFQIPEKVFIVIDDPRFRGRDAQKAKSDDYKPQYINFSNALLIQLFQKIMTKAPQYLMIEEMLPEPSLILQSKGERYVCEYLMEWETVEK